MNIRFEAKYALLIRTSDTKNPIRKFNHLPSYLGVKWGGGMEKCGNKALSTDVAEISTIV
jgi:hypothetical protein